MLEGVYLSQAVLDGANTEPVRTVEAALRIDVARIEVHDVSEVLRVSGREPHKTARANAEERTIRAVPRPRQWEFHTNGITAISSHLHDAVRI